MAQVPNANWAPEPSFDPVPLSFSADISDGPKAGDSANHLSGSASGYVASYPDLHAMAWWTAGETTPAAPLSPLVTQSDLEPIEAQQADHEARIAQLEADVADLQARVTTLEGYH